MVEGEATSPYVENSTPGRVWVEVMIFYYRDDQLADYDYMPPEPLVGYISADHVLDLANNDQTVRPGTTDLRLRFGPGKEYDRKAYLNSGDTTQSRVAVYYEKEVGGTTWSYVNSDKGCGWVMSYYIGVWN